MGNLGQALKALCLGASAVMLNSPLAGTDEAPGQRVLVDGRWMKMHHSQDPAQVMCEAKMKHTNAAAIPHNVSNLVPWQGSARALLRYFLHGLKCGMQDLGLETIEKLHDALDKGRLRLECRSAFA